MFNKKILMIILIIFFGFILVACGSEEEPIKEEKTKYSVILDIGYSLDSIIYDEEINEGDLIPDPGILTRTDYEFLGFFMDDTKWDFENDKVYNDLYLEAKWNLLYSNYELVVNKIDAIISNDAESIKEARLAYDALPAQEQKYVKNYRILLEAEISLVAKKASEATTVEEMKEVINLIDSYSDDTLLRLGSSVKNYYNKIFEITYKDKIDDAVNHKEDIVKAVATAFLDKGVYNQYDQTRRIATASPYDASVYDTLYLDCSAFCHSVYNYIFGTQTHVQLNTATNNSYCKSNLGTSPDVLYYIDTTKYTTKESQKAILDEIYANLQVGDLINYRHGKSSSTAGHVVMYYGDNTIIHSTGDDYGSIGNPDNFTEEQTSTEAQIGTVFTFSADQLFKDTSSSRYLFKKTTNDTVYEISVMRPLNINMTIGDKGISNYILSNVDITKTNNVGARLSVTQGEEITYTITLDNKNNYDINNVPIFQEINPKLEYVSSSDYGNYIDKIGIFYLVNLKANEKKEVTYTLKVSNDAIGSFTDGNTYIHNINLPKISNDIIGAHIDKAKFTEACSEFLNKNYNDSISFIKDCYDKYTNATGSITYTKDSDVIDDKDCGVPDLFKGSNVKRVLEKYIEVGDVITTYNQTTKKYTTYLVVDEYLLCYVKDGKVEKIEGKPDVQRFLDKLYAYNKYRITRPFTSEYFVGNGN